MTLFKGNRKYPNPATVTDDPRTHTLALQQIIEALNVGQRRTRDLQNSFVRLHELVDVGLIEIVNGQLKLTNLGESVVSGGASALADLTDVDLTGLSDGDTLVWNSATSMWEPGAGGGGGGLSDLYDQTLNNLADVGFYMPEDGDVLTYNAATGMWDAMRPPGGGYSGPTLYDLILSLSPTAYWKLDEASGTFADSSGNGNTLTGAGTFSYQGAALYPRSPTDRFVKLAASARVEMSGVPAGVSVPITGSWTVTGLYGPPATGYMFGIGGNGETAATNFQLSLATSGGGVLSFWESGSGTNRQIDYFATAVLSPANFTMVKRAGSLTVDLYINGLFAASGTYTVEPTGGSSVTTGIGSVSSAASGAMAAGHVAFFNGVELSDDDIIDIARAAGFAAA